MILWLASLAWAGETLPQPVVTEAGAALELDWTRMVLRATASAGTHGTESTRAVEELARRSLQVGMEQGVARIPVTSSVGFEALLGGPLGDALRSRMHRWEVTEAVYHASGRVELTAELSLQDLLKPWTLGRVGEPAETRATPITGLVVDARGSGAVPAWSPALLDADGAVLYDGWLWEEEAVTRAPVVYVADPAHPAAARAGERPLFLRAREARGPDLLLDAEEAARFRAEAQGARVLGEGTVVVVIDP